MAKSKDKPRKPPAKQPIRGGSPVKASTRPGSYSAAQGGKVRSYRGK